MPTTNSPKGSAIPVRFTEAQRRQIDELTAAGYGTQADVIRDAVSRMYQQEIGARTMKKKWEARVDELRQMVSDQYDPADGTPQEFVAWFVSESDEPFSFTDDDKRVMLREAGKMYDAMHLANREQDDDEPDPATAEYKHVKEQHEAFINTNAAA